MEAKLCFSVYGELFVVNLGKVMYFKADDHYTHICYASGTHFMKPFGLSKVEEAIHEKDPAGQKFVRLGRTYIVNLDSVFHVNTIKQELQVADDHGINHTIHLSKPVLRNLMNLLGGAASPETVDE